VKQSHSASVIYPPSKKRRKTILPLLNFPIF